MATQTLNTSQVGDSVQRWLDAYNAKIAIEENPALEAQDEFEANIQTYYTIEEFMLIQANARALLSVGDNTTTYDDIMAAEFPIIKEFFVINSPTFEYFKTTTQQQSTNSLAQLLQ